MKTSVPALNVREVNVTLFLTESDVRELLPMDRALDCVEASLVAQGHDHAVNRSRERILLPHVSLHYMAGALPESSHLGLKIYTVTREDFRFLLLLFDAETGSLLSLMQADYLGRIRTGAASGIATKYLARPEASHVGMIGTGRQARTQLQAIASVRRLAAVRAFGRDQNRLRSFCREMSEGLGDASGTGCHNRGSNAIRRNRVHSNYRATAGGEW